MSTTERLAFGEVLRRYRVAAGLTHEALAERAALSARWVQDLERGVLQVCRMRTPYGAWPRRSAWTRPTAPLASSRASTGR